MKRIMIFALVLALLIAFGVVGIAIAAVPTDTTALRNAVSVDGIMKHERAFQDIANSNDGTRVSGTPGYDASAAYVEKQLKAAGYNVTVQEFTYPFFQELPDTTFSRTAPRRRNRTSGAKTSISWVTREAVPWSTHRSCRPTIL